MLTLIRNAEVHAPEPRGRRDVLLAGARIAAVEADIRLEGGVVDSIDADGRWLLPGFVDPLTHPAGGGGEGGFANRTPELEAADFVAAGVTTPVGALGTDSITRRLEVLYGQVIRPVHVLGMVLLVLGMFCMGLGNERLPSAPEAPPSHPTPAGGQVR